jgi:uncharacterized membrane protein YtjA (UPF0391 family)
MKHTLTANRTISIDNYRLACFSFYYWYCITLKLKHMLRWTIIFLVIAIIAAIFGFGGIAAGAASIAKILFFIFLVLFVLSLIAGRRGSVGDGL